MKEIETDSRLDVFLKCTSHFSLLIAHFLGKPNETLLVLKDLQPNSADKASRPCLGISLKKIELG